MDDSCVECKIYLPDHVLYTCNHCDQDYCMAHLKKHGKEVSMNLNIPRMAAS